MGLVQDVFDARAAKLNEVMDKTEKAIGEVLADKIYTSNDFKKVKENFTNLAKILDNKEVTDWLKETSEMLSQGGASKAKMEQTNITAMLERFDKLGPVVNETKITADLLWQGYNYTDELAPHVEWLEEKKSLANRDINSNSADETEELIEKQEKVIDQLDKKRKVYMAVLDKGKTLMVKPKAPEFLKREVDRAAELWKLTNDSALDRLQRLRENQASWEQFENKRNDLTTMLDKADAELEDIRKLYELTAGTEDHKNRLKTAASIRKEIDTTFKIVEKANETVQVLLTEDMKGVLNDQVEELKQRCGVNDRIDEKLKEIDQFNGKLKTYMDVVGELETWTADGQKRMENLLHPTEAPSGTAEDVVLSVMELGDDIREQLKITENQENLWDSELGPFKATESSPESKALVGRMDGVKGNLTDLNTQQEAEAAKFGEDVKHLADFTNSNKKFNPWIEKSETKVKSGMRKVDSLEEGKVLLDEIKKWQEESQSMKTVIDNGNAAAQKMATHGEADRVYAENTKRWEVVDKAIKDWVGKMVALIKMWDEQAATADKVTHALSDAGGSDMKIEDLEEHLNKMKTMFIEKQKMMDNMNLPAA